MDDSTTPAEAPAGGDAGPNQNAPTDQMSQTDQMDQANQSGQPDQPNQPDQPLPDSNQAPNPDDLADGQNQPQSAGGDDAVTWTASEFIAHQKSPAWYGKLALAAVLIAGIIFLITRDPIATSAVVFCAFLFGVIAGRQPRQLEYRVDNDGVKIGTKEFDYEAFRSFSIVPEGAFSSIVFMPMKRFAPITTIYFAPEDEPRIVGLLSSWLPMEEYQHDALEQLMHRIRF